MLIVAKTENGSLVSYSDSKRYLWLLSVFSPAIPGIFAVVTAITGNPLWALFPLCFYYFAVPVLDMIVGKDETNPPEEVIEKLSQDGYYRLLLHLSVPVFYASFFAVFFVIGLYDLPLYAELLLVISAGVASGSGLTVGHELGHKQNRLDRLSAKLVNSLTGYAHFCIEHNQGHHVMVATPEDPASARYGESVYRFALREIPFTAIRGWKLEANRLQRKGFGFWTWRNDLLQGYFLTLYIAFFLVSTFDWKILPFLLLHHLFGWLQLTFANYVEHYGLLREKKSNGRYKPCEPRHSWNTNHLVSNLMLFHLQRHSDHHANPMKPYQALRNFDDLPSLPSGYPGSFALASIPFLWFRVMNRKVLDWAGGNMNKINTGPTPLHR